MSFDPHTTNLPIVDVIHEVKQHLQEENTLIVHAPPGAGKSTVIPLVLLEECWLKGQKIIMLEPRRLAAKTIATRLAELLGEPVGKRVGYRIRFDNCVCESTQLEVVTEGILTRMLQSDNALEGIGMVIFDEFHERSLFADVALALSREAQQILRPDLRIMIMSATLNMPQLTQLLSAPSVVSEGRQYPVEIHYEGDNDLKLLPELTSRVITKAVEKHDGDILVFLPGEGEIKNTEAILRNKHKGIAIHPLYGQLPPHKQFAAIMPSRDGRRKIILATSIAETSLTIEGVKVVVDCGFSRTLKFNPNTGLSRLETAEITLDSADQRAGRAGRLGPGVCYRMWTKATHHRLNKHRTPEIEEADLASLVLEMAKWGVDDINKLTWLTPPPKGHVLQANELLEQLDAIADGTITAHGKAIHHLPCHPRLAHMLLLAQNDNFTALACDIAAILEERDPLNRDAGIDINLRIEALRRYRTGTLKNKRLKHIAKISAQYQKMLNIDEDNSTTDPFETGLLLAYAYPQRIAHATPGNNAQFKLANGNIAAAGHEDDLAHEDWLSIASVNARDGVGRIFLASPLNPRDLAPMVKTVESISWDTKRGGFSAFSELRIGSIILQQKPLQNYNIDQKIKAISDVLKKEGAWLLDFNQEVEQWQNRINSLRLWDASNNWPDVSTSHLLATNYEWLSPYLNEVKKPEDLKKIDLKKVLQNYLPYELQQLLDKLAPERLQVPSGSNIKLKYASNGESPILAVRLQEVFGLLDTPTVNNGKVKILLHLLSPGFKPVQVTDDLNSFWNTTYFEVKKELKARYPKHHWPDNPLEAEPVRGVKRKNNS
ncbi:ATP-dependent helicase HrpB [Draconibacterium orientale]|uniref:ATP-dependent helicase HrpB n=1 Tax=Draconibacterium orientale TaxID=1168034 RepID=X5DIP8_9BACT|nr:ATP-dependent helicase HrpB [Draconibacterium orientale]AHW60989.1 DEAD/DEAH box helicase [Draconibacterium orientale]SET87286.1 ATP-dependent helicase HrpB [Draconibacterium orientale]